MSQRVSQAVQKRIDELVQRTREKDEERKKKALLAGEAASTGQGCTSKSDKGQETTMTVSAVGYTMTIEHIKKGDELTKTQKTDDESEHEKELDIEECEEVDTEAHERTTDEETEDEPSIVEFEDPVYELSQAHEMEPEYESMTAEQEVAEVQALSPVGQGGYRELTKLHQHQADIERKMTGVTKIIEERTKARAPSLPVDLIRRHVWEEPAGRQELHQMMKRQQTQF